MKLDPEKTWVSISTVCALGVGLLAAMGMWMSFTTKVQGQQFQIEAHQKKLDATDGTLQKITESLSRIEQDASITRIKVEYLERRERRR